MGLFGFRKSDRCKFGSHRKGDRCVKTNFEMKRERVQYQNLLQNH